MSVQNENKLIKELVGRMYLGYVLIHIIGAKPRSKS